MGPEAAPPRQGEGLLPFCPWHPRAPGRALPQSERRGDEGWGRGPEEEADADQALRPEQPRVLRSSGKQPTCCDGLDLQAERTIRRQAGAAV